MIIIGDSVLGGGLGKCRLEIRADAICRRHPMRMGIRAQEYQPNRVWRLKLGDEARALALYKRQQIPRGGRCLAVVKGEAPRERISRLIPRLIPGSAQWHCDKIGHSMQVIERIMIWNPDSPQQAQSRNGRGNLLFPLFLFSQV